MNLVALQIALFLSSKESRPDKLVDFFNSQMGGVFDDIPNILRLPENVPDGIPIVQMSSENGKHQLHLSRERFDYFISFPCQPQDDKIYSGVDLVTESIVFGFVKATLEKYKTSRLGCLGTVFINDANSIQRIGNKYFRDVEIKNCTELSIRLNRITKLKKRDINNVLSINNVNISANQESFPGVWVQYDVNNIPIEGRDLTEAEISTIWKHFTEMMSEESIKKVI